MTVSVLENKTFTWSGKMFNSQRKLHYVYVFRYVFQTKRKCEYEHFTQHKITQDTFYSKSDV